MHAHVGDFVEPAAQLHRGRGGVEHQTGLLELRDQRGIERAPQIAVEALDLALGSRPVEAARLDHEPGVTGVVQEARVVAVRAFAFALDIALEHYGLHVVVQHLAHHASERREAALMAADQRRHLHVGDKLDVAHAAVAEGTQNAYGGRALLRNSTQSSCIWWPGAVSKRTTGSEGCAGLSVCMSARNWLAPPGARAVTARGAPASLHA